MAFLLDTHVFLWWVGGHVSLSRQAVEAIENPEHPVFVSAASVWEMAIKASLGKLRIPDDVEGALLRHRFMALPVALGHAHAVGALPPHHGDPFDRMLVAQAQCEGLSIITRDANIPAYDVPCIAA